MIGNNKNTLQNNNNDLIAGRQLYVTNILLNGINFENKKVCEIGPGFGWFSRFLAKSNCAEIHTVDINLENKKDILSLNQEFDSVVTFQQSNTDHEINKKDFDYIFAFEVMEHIEKDTEVIFMQSLKNALSNDGVIFLSTPSNDYRSKYIDPAFYLTDHRHYGIKDYLNYSKKAGLKVTNYEFAGGWFSNLDMYNLYISKWIFRRKRFFEDFFNKGLNKDYLEKANRNRNKFSTIFVSLIKEINE